MLYEKIVYQSFYGVPLTFSYFLLQGKVLFFRTCRQLTSLARCSLPKTLSKILYLRLYLAQIVHSNGKMLFLKPNKCLSKFLWRAAHIFLLSVFRQSRRRQVCDLCDLYCLKRSEDLVEKIISPVIFDTNRSLKQ